MNRWCSRESWGPLLISDRADARRVSTYSICCSLLMVREAGAESKHVSSDRKSWCSLQCWEREEGEREEGRDWEGFRVYEMV